ncbi:unnamed protein product [Adineta ricciae]|uniref:Uncharacterized protein n=1 Tax=Adineta ricciae TaxID=249248 RepID=A0A813YAZ6_ADIRI|nr:unnamed protein product [Adineta ricciae]
MNYDERNDENRENVTIIWFNSTNENLQVKLKQLREINDYVLYFNQFDQCFSRIQSIENETMILILTENDFAKFSSLIDKSSQIDSIFLFDENSKSSNDCPKVIGAYDNFQLLCHAIEQQINSIEKQFQTLTIWNQKNEILKDFSRQSAEFLWFLLLKNVLYQFPSNQFGKRQFIEKCQMYYQGNSKKLAEINDFEENYRSDLALEWFLKKSFVSKLLNKALRRKDMIELLNLRFFILDLSNNLRKQHEKLRESNEKVVHAYKEMKMSIEELNQLKEKHEKFISFNGYLVASKSRNKTLASISKSVKTSKKISVLLEIQCSIEDINEKTLFAESSSNEKEILFDLGNVFQIENIHEENQITMIKLNSSNQQDEIVQDFLRINPKETNFLILLGKLTFIMGCYQKTMKYFEQLLIYQKDLETIRLIQFYLARSSHLQGDLKRAKDLYDQIYDGLMHSNPINRKDTGEILNQIGHVFELQSNYDEALRFYEKSLETREKTCSSDDPDIAISLISIANLYFKRQKYNEALEHFQRAVIIQEKLFPNYFNDLVKTLNLMGKVLLKQGKSSDALKTFQKALKIQEDFHSNDYPDKIDTFENISLAYEKLKIPRMALVHYKKILAIEQKYLSTEHPQRIQTEKNIQRLSSLK